jgi:hypothetical protein
VPEPLALSTANQASLADQSIANSNQLVGWVRTIKLLMSDVAKVVT